jgi:hypothetical protein
MFKSNFQIRNKTRLCYSKQKQNSYTQEHEMCKTNMKMNLYCVNICKHEDEKNITRLWCKIVFKINVE